MRAPAQRAVRVARRAVPAELLAHALGERAGIFTGGDLWLDDVVIDDERIHCPAK